MSRQSVSRGVAAKGPVMGTAAGARLVRGVASLLVLASVLVPAARADSVTATASIASGGFHVRTSLAVDDTGATLVVHVADDRGTGAGWRVRLSSHAAASLSLGSMRVERDGPGTYTMPAGPSLQATALLAPSGSLTLLQARGDTGMGHFRIVLRVRGHVAGPSALGVAVA
jgi:hypothetical protein